MRSLPKIQKRVGSFIQTKPMIKKVIILTSFILLSLTQGFSQEGFIGEVRMFAGNFAPRGWAFCDGQLMPIAQYSALFSILGTMYGGDGRTTFALPDLRGRTAVGVGNGPGLTERRQGEKFGSETNTLTVRQLPAHTHEMKNKVLVMTGGEGDPDVQPGAQTMLGVGNTPNDKIIKSTGSTGENQPINNVQPSLGIRYIICVQGTFPSRN